MKSVSVKTIVQVLFARQTYTPKEDKLRVVRLTQKDLEKANAEVKRSIEHEDVKSQKANLRGKYNDSTPQERAWIGKYELPLYSDPGGYHILSYTAVLPLTMESMYFCIFDGLGHNSLVETLP